MKYIYQKCTDAPPCYLEMETIQKGFLKNQVVAVESEKVKILIQYKDQKWIYQPTHVIQSGPDGKSRTITIFSHLKKSLDQIDRIPIGSTIIFQLEKSSWLKPLILKLKVRE